MSHGFSYAKAVGGQQSAPSQDTPAAQGGGLSQVWGRDVSSSAPIPQSALEACQTVRHGKPSVATRDLTDNLKELSQRAAAIAQPTAVSSSKAGFSEVAIKKKERGIWVNQRSFYNWKEKLKAEGKETNDISEDLDRLSKGYSTDDISHIFSDSFIQMAKESLQQTKTYTGVHSITDQSKPSPDIKTDITVTSEYSLDCCQRLNQEGKKKIAGLIFASAKNPGGGFDKGATAQEESIARASLLVRSQRISPMYTENTRDNKQCLYSDTMIFSGNTPVIKDSRGNYINPYPISFISAPAVNLRAHYNKESRYHSPTHVIQQIMRGRAKMILEIALSNGCKHLILGAWGCGVFKNDPKFIATIFMELLSKGGQFHNCFESVTFAIPQSRNPNDPHDPHDPHNIFRNKLSKI